MNELKTLKDIARSKAYWNLSEVELKAEAVKWVKTFDDLNEPSSLIWKWMEFFNLTDEDLK